MAAGVGLTLAWLVAMGVFIRWMVVRSRREQAAHERTYQLIEAAIVNLGGQQPSVSPRGSTWSFKYSERQVHAHRRAHKGGSEVALDIELEPHPTAGPSPFRRGAEPGLARLPRLKLRRENRRDRFGKALRLNRELQLGDARFDAVVYVESDANDDELRALLHSERARHAAIGLVELGCEVIFNDEGRSLAAVWRAIPPPRFEENELGEAMALLSAVADALPVVGAIEPVKAWPRGSVLSLCAGLGLVASWVVFLIGEQFFQPLGTRITQLGLEIGAIVFTLLAAITFFRVRATSRALRYLGWTLVFGLAACPLMSVGAVKAANGLFDASVERRSATVRKRWTTSGKSTQYYMLLEPWPPHERPIEVRVDDDEYPRIPDHGPVELRIGRGALGFEWYAGLAR
jgi:hypothetical protein